MKISIKFKVLLLVIGLFFIQIIICNSSYCKENNLKDYLTYALNSVQQVNTSTTITQDSILCGLVSRWESVEFTNPDAELDESNLFEPWCYDTGGNSWEASDVHKEDGTIAKNISVRYSWLHKLKELVNYIQGGDIGYKDIAVKNESHWIKLTVATLQTCRHCIGTFSAADEDIDTIEVVFRMWWVDDNTGVSNKRSKNAFKNIIGTSDKDSYEKKIYSCIQELRAANDYTEQTPYYGDSVYILDDFETKSNYTEAQIKRYLDEYGQRYGVSEEERTQLIEAWEEKTGTTVDEMTYAIMDSTSTEDIDEEYTELNSEHLYDDPDKDVAFKQPDQNNTATTSSAAISDAVNDAEAFLERGNNSMVSSTKLQTFSQSIYNILLTIGIVLAVIIGMILGIKLMVAPIEQRVEAKKLLVPYVVGCIVVFGAFGVWKLIVSIVQGM